MVFLELLPLWHCLSMANLISKPEPMQVGVDSFAARFPDENGASSISASDSIRQLVERIEFADQMGLDVFGVG